MVGITHQWIIDNFPIIIFVYGQVFFILGIAIVMQSRRYSHLKLAHSLGWLAGFGFLHGFNEWGDLFIPLQRGVLPEPVIFILRIFQLLLLAGSFFCLLQFGFQLLQPITERWRFMKFVPIGLLMLWIGIPFWLGFILIGDKVNWGATANTFARYMLGFPGGIVAAFGIIYQTREQISRLQLPKIERALKVAAGALIAYSILGGLIVPSLNFFPANVINVETFTQIFIFPPQIFRSLAGLVLLFSIIYALEVFDIETDQMIRNMEESQVIAIERERIARDLHDNVLQQIYAAGLMAELLSRKVPEALKNDIQRLMISIDQIIEQMRAFLPQLQPDMEEIELIPAIKPILDEASKAIKVEANLNIEPQLKLTPEQINHIRAFTRESVSNAIRHSQSSRLDINLYNQDEYLFLEIRDYGKGLPENVNEGYGLRNMRDRARWLGADIKITSSGDEGVTIVLKMKAEAK